MSISSTWDTCPASDKSLLRCVRENFRLTPVFTMPLARRVMAPEGVIIAGRHIPQGVSLYSCSTNANKYQLCDADDRFIQTSVAVCNHAYHHNPEVWGADHNVFLPSRWDNPDLAKRARSLMHFGLGGRQCIGKTVAQTNIYKLSSTLLREFEFELADAEETVEVENGAFIGKMPNLVSVGVSDLQEPLMVRARRRGGSLREDKAHEQVHAGNLFASSPRRTLFYELNNSTR